jgi:hypothetical protein
MNTLLDSRSLLLITGGLYLLLPLSVWLVLRMPRQRATLLWCGGGMLGGLGFGLFAARGFIPDALSYLLGQPLLLLALLVCVQSLREDLGRPWPWRWVFLTVFAYTLLLAWMLPIAEVSTLGILVRSVNLCAILALVWAAWAVGVQENSRNAKTIAGAYVMLTVGIAMNLALAWQGSPDFHTLRSTGVTVISSLLMLMASLISSMSYLGLALDRLARSREEVALQLANDRYWEERRQAVHVLERERTLAALVHSIRYDLEQPLTGGLLRVQMAQRLLASDSCDPVKLNQAVQHLIHHLGEASAVVKRIPALVEPVPPKGKADA